MGIAHDDMACKCHVFVYIFDKLIFIIQYFAFKVIFWSAKFYYRAFRKSILFKKQGMLPKYAGSIHRRTKYSIRCSKLLNMIYILCEFAPVLCCGESSLVRFSTYFFQPVVYVIFMDSGK